MTIACLTHLYTPAGLLVDGDGDGLPDGLRVRFSLGRTPGAVDVAARLGLESAAVTPGFTDAGEGITVWFGPDNPECPALSVPAGCGLVALAAGGLVVTGATPADGWMAARWLAQTFPFTHPDGGRQLLADLAGGRPVRAVVLRDGGVADLTLGDGPAVAVADKPTVRKGPDEAPFRAPVPGDLPPEGLARLFSVAGLLESSDDLRHDRVGWQVQVGPKTTVEELAGLCELAARSGVEATGMRFPVALDTPPSGGGLAVRLCDDAPPAAWVEGHLAWDAGGLAVFGRPAERAAALRAAAESGLVDGLHAGLFTRRAALPVLALEPGAVLFDLALAQEWEVDRFRRVWAEQVLPALRAGEPVDVDLRLSEPASVRSALADEVAATLAAAGVTEAHIRVLSAYKQGFHWLEEEVLPRLQAVGPIARVTVTCRPFGTADAASVDQTPVQGSSAANAGVAPASGAAGDLRGTEGATRSGAALEMPIRWLQELYPADELLAAALHVAVSFDLATAPQSHIYQLSAYRADGSVALTEGFSPICASRTYLPEFPARGRVHPPTGLLRVAQGDRNVVELAIDTDAEAFWTAYQEQVLPRVRSFVLERFGPNPAAEAQPFFGTLLVEVAMSEDDRRLGIREEQISPLDALHEDLYFYTLDYLNELGIALTGKGYPAPGAVEPWVAAGEGGVRARIRLLDRPAARDAANVAGLPVQAAALPAPSAVPGVPQDQIIGPDQLPPLLAYLATLPGVRTWRAGLTFAGRPTWALSVCAPTAGRIAPPQKLSAWRPTLLVNARHHANEISSTNSILKLAELVAANPEWTRRVNLVLSPLENADGAAVHYAMQAEHPNWKLHAARFNAAGVDFNFDWFAPQPRFGESRTLPTLWRACLPDVVLDDHGYPSHEWVQPFSGYSSAPYFKTSWWMPNALIYGIHRWMDSERYPAHARAQEALRDAMADRFAANPEIRDRSRVMLDRYTTYGMRYVPHKFPLQLHHGMVSMTGKVADGPDARTFVGRFPLITATELITEVSDETAQGEYLAMCARAHLEGDLAVLDFLSSHPQPVERRWSQQGDRVLWTVGRERPLRV